MSAQAISVIARSAATRQSSGAVLDCFASLAMTRLTSSSFAPLRLCANQKEGLGSHGGAETRREGGLDSRFRASEGETVK